MGIEVRHTKILDVPDDDTPDVVQPSDWNAPLVVELTGALAALDQVEPAANNIPLFIGPNAAGLMAVAVWALGLLSSADEAAFRAAIGAAAAEDALLTGAPTAPTPPNNDDTTRLATTAFVHALITAGSAPIDSPHLTGVPTAPTAAPGTNTTQIATMAAVQAAIAALLNSAPGALDTLDELAAALGDDANFAATITGLLALKAPLNSPGLTGVPTAPTVAGTADNSTKIATTAFVQAVIAALVPSDTFATRLFHVRDQKAVNTAGGTFTSGANRTRDLNNTVVNQIAGASLASNQITLPAGTYVIDARAPGQACGNHRAILRNITAGATQVVGSNAACSSGGGTMTDSFVRGGPFVLAAPAAFEIQHICATTRSTDGFGYPMNMTEVEVYTDVKIWKVA